MEVSEDMEGDRVDNKMVKQVMHLENMKDSIMMLSQQVPDMVFLAQNGQSVQCHRSLVGLFSSSLTGIINTVPGWLDTVVILPDSSFDTVSYIVSALYGNTAEHSTEDIDVDEMEITAQLMGVKIPKVEKAPKHNNVEVVTTLNESVVEETSSNYLNNVEIKQEPCETEVTQNTCEEEGDQSNLTILQMLREEVSRVFPKTPLKRLKKVKSKISEPMDCSPQFDEKTEVLEKDTILEHQPVNIGETNKRLDNEPIGEQQPENIGEKCNKGYQLSWIPDEKIEMIEDNFVEKAITHTPLPKPKKFSAALSNKKKENMVIKESNIIMNIARLKEERVEPDNTAILNNPTTAKTSEKSQTDVGIVECVKKPRISLVSMTKLVEPSSPEVENDPLGSLQIPHTEPVDVNLNQPSNTTNTDTSGAIAIDSSVSTSSMFNARNMFKSIEDKKTLPEQESEVEDMVTKIMDIAANVPNSEAVAVETNPISAETAPENINNVADSPDSEDVVTTSIVNQAENLSRQSEDKLSSKLNHEPQTKIKEPSADSDETIDKGNEENAVTKPVNEATKVLKEPAIENITIKAEPMDESNETAIYFDEASSEHLNASLGITLDNPLAEGNPLEQSNPLSPTALKPAEHGKALWDGMSIPATSFEFPKVSEIAPAVHIKKEPLDEEAVNSEQPPVSEQPISIKTEVQTPQKLAENPGKPLLDSPIVPKSKNIPCDLCLESFSLKIDLAKHYSKAHFEAELTATFSEYFTDDDFCIKCESKIDESKEDKLEHVGQKHKKVFYVMKEKGMDVIELFRENRVRKPPQPIKEVKNTVKNNNPLKPKDMHRNQSKSTNTAGQLSSVADFPVGCKKCTFRFSSTPQLLKHYSTIHFFSQLKSKITSCFVKNRCKLCGHSLLGEKDKVAHLGFKHDKVLDLLKHAGIKIDSSTGTKSLPLLPTSKTPVILHGTTKIMFEAEKNIPTNKVEVASGLKSFKLSSTVRCQIVEDKNTQNNTKYLSKSNAFVSGLSSAKPVSSSTVTQPDKKKLKITLNPKDETEPEKKKLKITHNPKDETYERIKSPDLQNHFNIEDNKNVPMNEDDPIAKALADSLNTFESESKKEKTETETETKKQKMETETKKSVEEKQSLEEKNDDSYLIKRKCQNANEPRNFKCAICPKRYTNNPHLNDHYSGFHYKDELCKKYGNDDTTLSCIFCGKVSSNRVKYAMHIGNVHQKLGDYGIKFSKPEGKYRPPRKSSGKS